MKMKYFKFRRKILWMSTMWGDLIAVKMFNSLGKNLFTYKFNNNIICSQTSLKYLHKLHLTSVHPRFCMLIYT